MSRVRIGTCTGPADAALVRSAFEAHNIPVLINAEQHASMLGGLGGVFVPLHIFVDEEYAEEAAGLLRDLREHDHTTAAEDDSAAPDDDDDDDDDEIDAVAEAKTERRRRIGVLMLISLSGAFAVPFVFDRPILGVLLVAALIAAIFAAMRGKPKRKQQPLPQARVTKSGAK